MLDRKPRLFCKDFRSSDERRTFKNHGYLDILRFDDGFMIGRGHFEPGWKWSLDVKPISETASCEAPHRGYCISGSMVVRMDSGEEITIKPGDAFDISPGHDAWVIGSHPCVLIEVAGTENYAKRLDQEAA